MANFAAGAGRRLIFSFMNLAISFSSVVFGPMASRYRAKTGMIWSPGDLRTALGDAEGYSLRIAFVRATGWARKSAAADKITFVFDSRKEKEAEGKRIFQLFEHFSEIETKCRKARVYYIFRFDHDTALASC